MCVCVSVYVCVCVYVRALSIEAADLGGRGGKGSFLKVMSHTICGTTTVARQHVAR